ncbi:MAG: hypothetical protein AB8B55_05370 [Mariniblastus sp.]
MAFHIPFNQRASAQRPPAPIYIGFEVPTAPRQKFNWWGFNGMWMSAASLLSGGFLSPVPLLISLNGLRKPGKKMAATGTVISLGGIMLASALVMNIIAHQNHREHVRNSRAVHKQVLQTKTLLTAAGTEIQEYCEDNQGMLPGTVEGNISVIKHIDSWDKSLRFELGNNEAVIRSAGPDREFNTNDDLIKNIKGDAERYVPVAEKAPASTSE